MQTAQQLATTITKSFQNSLKTSGKTEVHASERESVNSDGVNRVFGAIKAAFPGQYAKHYEGVEKRQYRNGVKRMWATSKEFQCLSSQQIEKGIRRMVDECEFMPSLAEFVKLCQIKPEDYGIPGTQDAWQEANDKAHLVMQGGAVKWSHPIIAEAGKGQWQAMRQCDEFGVKKVQTEFERRYHYLIKTKYSKQGLKEVKAPAIEDRSDAVNKQAVFTKMQAEQIIDKQGIPTDGAAARAQLMGMFK